MTGRLKTSTKFCKNDTIENQIQNPKSKIQMRSIEPVETQSFDNCQPTHLSPKELELVCDYCNDDPVERRKWSFWMVFSSTFLTIFLAEMGDKTQLATLLMSAQSQSPWIVFAGAAAALVATSLVGVVVGYWLAKKLSPKTLDLAVAMLLLLISGLLLGDVLTA
jgi:putative Ca2+/H+ antiporter (TMEM165/GDT1 family)